MSYYGRSVLDDRELDMSGRCAHHKGVSISAVLTAKGSKMKEVDDGNWLVSFMHYDIGFFDDETCRLEPAPKPWREKVLPISPE